MPEIRRTTMCDPNTPVTYRPADYLPRLRTLFDAFVSYVAEEAPSAYGAFRESAARRFRELIDEVGGAEASAVYLELFPDSDALQRARLSYVLGLLGLTDEEPTGECVATKAAGTSARLLPAYYQAVALSDVLGRTEAIPMIKAFVDRWLAETVPVDESLEDPGRFWDDLEGEQNDVTQVAARLHRGRIAFRVERCLWADVLAPLEDPEIAHAGACYGDFSQITALNPNFVLTRSTTLVEGGPYCDTCIHDRRHVESIEHPNRAFFDGLGTS